MAKAKCDKDKTDAAKCVTDKTTTDACIASKAADDKCIADVNEAKEKKDAADKAA